MIQLSDVEEADINELPCLNFSLRKAVRVLGRIYDQYLSPTGLTGGQFSILFVLDHLGVATNKKLQSVLVLDQTTLSRNLKPLLREGYISSTPGINDRRQKDLRLTQSGQEKFQEAHACWLQAQKKIYTQLGSDLSRQLVGLSGVIVDLD